MPESKATTVSELPRCSLKSQPSSDRKHHHSGPINFLPRAGVPDVPWARSSQYKPGPCPRDQVPTVQGFEDHSLWNPTLCTFHTDPNSLTQQAFGAQQDLCLLNIPLGHTVNKYTFINIKRVGSSQPPGFWASNCAQRQPLTAQWHQERGERMPPPGREVLWRALGWEALQTSGGWGDLHPELKTFSTWQNPHWCEPLGPWVTWKHLYLWSVVTVPPGGITPMESNSLKVILNSLCLFGNHGIYTSKSWKIKALWLSF